MRPFFLAIASLPILLAGCSGSPNHAERPDADRADAALLTLKSMAGERHADFGFMSGAEAQAAVLDEPIEEMWPDQSGIEAAARSSNIDALRTHTTEWLYPVLVAGEPRCLIVFDQADGEWVPGVYGYSALAREVGRLRAGLPKGTAVRLARSYAVDFILLVYHAPDGRSMAIPVIPHSPKEPRARPLADALNEILSDLRREEPSLNRRPTGGPPSSGS